MDTQEVLSEVVKFIKDASPALWDTLLLQVKSNAISQLVWGIVVVLISAYLFKFCLKESESEYSTDQELAWIAGLFGVLVALVGLLLVTSGIMQLVNPAYYAVKILMNLIP